MPVALTAKSYGLRFLRVRVSTGERPESNATARTSRSWTTPAGPRQDTRAALLRQVYYGSYLSLFGTGYTGHPNGAQQDGGVAQRKRSDGSPLHVHVAGRGLESRARLVTPLVASGRKAAIFTGSLLWKRSESGVGQHDALAEGTAVVALLLAPVRS